MMSNHSLVSTIASMAVLISVDRFGHRSITFSRSLGNLYSSGTLSECKNLSGLCSESACSCFAPRSVDDSNVLYRTDLA